MAFTECFCDIFQAEIDELRIERILAERLREVAMDSMESEYEEDVSNEHSSEESREKRLQFMGSRGKKNVAFFGSRGKKGNLAFLGSRGKKSSGALSFLGSRGKKEDENTKRQMAFFGSRG